MQNRPNKFTLEVGILIALVVILGVVLLYLLIKFLQLIYIWKFVLVNNRSCQETNGLCQITINPSATAPETNFATPPPYSRDLAKYCLENISRVALIYASYWNKGYVLPVGLTDVSNLIAYPNSPKPVMGKILTDTNHERAWIFFRGTQSLQEWMVDFSFGQLVPQPKAHRQTLMPLPENKSFRSMRVNGPEVRIHKGFLNTYNKIRAVIIDFLKANPQLTQIIISGHSLGAALAVVCGYDLMQEGYMSKTIVYVFACPRVGNIAFSESFRTPCFRVTNLADVVPTMPLSVMPDPDHPKQVLLYQHVGTDGLIFQDNWQSLANNHQIPNYASNL